MLPTFHENNVKACVTFPIFEKTLLHWDAKLRQKKQKFLLLVDNCPSHFLVDLTNIRLEFLPPNTTSILQPMDQGVIKCLKNYFRMFLVLKMIESVEQKLEIDVTVLHTIIMLTATWEKVTAMTISNCFSHAGFKNSVLESHDEFVDIQNKVDQLGVQLPIPFDKFVTLDDEIITAEVMSEDAIVQSVMDIPEDEIQDNDDQELLPGTMDEPTTAEA